MIKNAELVLSNDKLIKGIIAQADVFNHLFQYRTITLMPIMEGADFYCQTLSHYLNFQFILDPVKVSSYAGTQSKELRISKHPHTDLSGRTVLVLDDIYDTGRTMAYVKNLCIKRSVTSVFSSVLLYKLNVPDQLQNILDFSCFNIPNNFVVGSGLDFDGKYRELEGVWKLPTNAY